MRWVFFDYFGLDSFKAGSILLQILYRLGNFIVQQVGVDTPAVNDAGRVFSSSPKPVPYFSRHSTLDFLISGIIAPALQVIPRFFFDGSFFYVLDIWMVIWFHGWMVSWLDGFMAELLKG